MKLLGQLWFLRAEASIGNHVEYGDWLLIQAGGELSPPMQRAVQSGTPPLAEDLWLGNPEVEDFLCRKASAFEDEIQHEDLPVAGDSHASWTTGEIFYLRDDIAGWELGQLQPWMFK